LAEVAEVVAALSEYSEVGRSHFHVSVKKVYASFLKGKMVASIKRDIARLRLARVLNRVPHQGTTQATRWRKCRLRP
jgi:hypothetical protein